MYLSDCVAAGLDGDAAVVVIVYNVIEQRSCTHDT